MAKLDLAGDEASYDLRQSGRDAAFEARHKHVKRFDWNRLVRRRGDKRRSGVFCKQSEMLEIRISLPLKQALAEHCRSTGVNRSEFVRAAIEDRIERDRNAGPQWLAAGDSVVTLLQSQARTIAAASMIVVFAFGSALSLRPDTSSMLIMLEMTALAHESPAGNRTGAPMGHVDHADA